MDAFYPIIKNEDDKASENDTDCVFPKDHFCKLKLSNLLYHKPRNTHQIFDTQATKKYPKLTIFFKKIFTFLLRALGCGLLCPFEMGSFQALSLMRSLPKKMVKRFKYQSSFVSTFSH